MEINLKQEAIRVYAAKFTDKLSKPFFLSQNAITGAEITTFSDVRQINLFILKNLFVKWQREVIRFKSPYFDYENEEVKDALNVFMNTLSNNIVVRKYDFDMLLKQAVEEMITLVCDPVTFFTKEVGTLGQPKVMIDSLLNIQKYFIFNKHILVQASTEIAEQGQDDIFAGEAVRFFLRILHEKSVGIDDPQEAISQLSAVLPCVMSDFIVKQNIVSPPPVKLVDQKPEPTPMMVQERGSITVAEFDSQEEEEIESTFSDQKNTNTQKSPALSNLFKRHDDDENVDVVAEKFKKIKIESIKTGIPLHLKFMFINTLFKGNHTDWNEAIEELDKAKNLESALNTLKVNYASKFEWDMNDENVTTLIEIIERKF